MRTGRILAAIVLSALVLPGQDAVPKMRSLGGIGSGIGGVMEFADGSVREFHVEARAERALLTDKRMPTEGRPIAAGSDAEKTLLAALEAWIAATFTPEQQQELLGKERLPDVRTQEETWAHWEAELLRAVRLYVEVTRPEVTKVFGGRGTVSVSLLLRLGDDPPRHLLWQRLGADEFARMHLGTSPDPVPFDSREEGRLLLGLANWLAARLGGPDQLWQPEPSDLSDDARLVLRAWRGYMEATSPRLAATSVIMNAGPTGSRWFQVSDSRRRLQEVQFDYAANTATPGRLRDGGMRDAPVVDLGSPREAELLSLLARTAELRRKYLGEAAANDTRLRMLEEELGKYRTTFHPDAVKK